MYDYSFIHYCHLNQSVAVSDPDRGVGLKHSPIFLITVCIPVYRPFPGRLVKPDGTNTEKARKLFVSNKPIRRTRT
jgi:hypothetical protein